MCYIMLHHVTIILLYTLSYCVYHLTMHTYSYCVLDLHHTSSYRVLHHLTVFIIALLE